MLSFPCRSIGQAYRSWTRVFTLPVRQFVGQWASDGDANGIMTFLGTSFGTVSWTNPHSAGKVTIGAFNSSGAADIGAGTVAGAVNHDNTDDNRTSNAPGSFWMVTLGASQRLAVNKYSFRSRPTAAGSDASNVHSLKFQGSNDGSTWVDLDVQTNITYTLVNEWKTFPVAGAPAYRYHRFLHVANVTGANSFFFMCEMELYGTLTY